MLRHSLSLFGALVLSPGMATAHHSAVQFDFGQSVTVEGVIKELRVENPHIKLVLEVSDEKGTRDIEYEGHSRNNVFRSGWRPHLIGEGDKVSIRIAPMRNGEDGGYVRTFVLDDGTEF